MNLRGTAGEGVNALALSLYAPTLALQPKSDLSDFGQLYVAEFG